MSMCVHATFMDSLSRTRTRENEVAQRTVVQLVDDFDGTELQRGEGETVRVTLDGAEYELDLSSKNA
ncbi:MAG TPA: histone-like nucleoid-structuring protein Lsr2, partial [Nocardioidaceae bacterium]|nr:histone-like nucleoid-structuring protein Lsr2 [Nocardioidaceae bacterium]